MHLIAALRAASACTPMLLLAGCASELTAVFDRTFRTDTYSEGRVSSATVTGERRIILVRPRREWASRDPVVCAESLPDVARAVAARSEITGREDASHGELRLNSQFTTAVLQTFTRTEIVEASRNLAWHACLAYANGGMNETQYRDELHYITERTFAVLALPHNQPAALPSNAVVPPPASPPTPPAPAR